MRATTLYIRFYRSFNYDYERKAYEDPRRRPSDWELIDGIWYPFVRVPLDPAVTAVVGANESGKSHLIGAMRAALTGDGIHRRQFCRHSSLFSVETGRVRVPDIGIEVELETTRDVDPLREASISARVGDRVKLLRMGDEAGSILLVDKRDRVHQVSRDLLGAFEACLPKPFELKTGIAIPDSVSIDDLLQRPPTPLRSRKSRFTLIDRIKDVFPLSADDADPGARIVEVLASSEAEAAQVDNASRAMELSLARDLLTGVAKIELSAFRELEEAIRDGEEGRVDGLIEEMNRSLGRHLNFAKWWRQDPEFQLRIAPREREIVFTIRDRTGTDYSFSERSRGLTFFLSYFVQLMTHRELRGERPEVLLIDEPDAYLSSAGQQDLLRTLENFAQPEGFGRRDQVLYVTHSPFLINKNAAHRIRVLDKGSNYEGTRVVKDVARNHYEPLRSSIGAYTAETSFIGGANLLVEGVADQLLLVGLTNRLRHIDTAPSKLLDLNDVTIVPAGSASAIPYTAYLARGRDVIKPPCVALLDGDEQGHAAEKKLARHEHTNRQILAREYVLVLDKWATDHNVRGPTNEYISEIEDLVPVPIAVHAARQYAVHLLQVTDADAQRLAERDVHRALEDSGGRLWPALLAAFSRAFDGSEMDKVGFAREVVDYVLSNEHSRRRRAGMVDIESRFGLLIADLAERLRRATAGELERRRTKRIRRIVGAFLEDYQDSPICDEADSMLRDIEVGLEDNHIDDQVKIAVADLRRTFRLTASPLEPVAEFSRFRSALERLPLLERFAHQDREESDSVS